MPAYNFQECFSYLVEAGAKRQTIRAKRTARPQVGQWAHCFTGMRTARCRRLGAWQIVAVADIYIDESGVIIDGAAMLSGDLDALAFADGFRDWDLMLEWFRDQHGLPFRGDLIMWHGSDDPYADGCDAYLAGFPETDNPFAPTTDDHLSWNDGWMDTEKREGGGE